MKCKDCDACHKGYFKSKPDDYVCIGVCEPFVIRNIDNECIEYKNLKEYERGFPLQIYSRVFTFNEENLLRDMANYERDTAKEVTELQCNIKTYQVWVGLYRPELSYAVEIEEIGDGIMARYKGIPIVINDKLDDGTVAIK